MSRDASGHWVKLQASDLYIRYNPCLCFWDIRHLCSAPPRLTVSVRAPATTGEEALSTGDKGLKKDAIGFSDGLTIALASTAPAYSLAAVIGSIVVIVGFQAPAALLVSFVPMFFIAAAFYYMNRADQDCGTSFSWVTRAIGPQSGWITGWAICVTGILVVGSLADVAAYSFFDLIGGRIAGRKQARGDAPGPGADRGDDDDLRARHRALGPPPEGADGPPDRAAAALRRGRDLQGAERRRRRRRRSTPSLSWFNPFAIESGGALTGALLLGVFIYWGWESAVNLNEETEGAATAPGLAGLVSTVLLLVTYLGVATALVAWKGDVGSRAASTTTRGSSPPTPTGVLGEPLGSLVLLAVVVSALASTQTTILPASRTSLSMARAEAMPSALGEVSSRYFTPVVSTVAIGAPRGRLVPALEADQRKLPLRLALGAGADDRLLLRLHGRRLRRLLPARAAQVGEELPLHRRRAGDRRGAARLPLRQGADRLLRPGELLHRRLAGSASRRRP